MCFKNFKRKESSELKTSNGHNYYTHFLQLKVSIKTQRLQPEANSTRTRTNPLTTSNDIPNTYVHPPNTYNQPAPENRLETQKSTSLEPFPTPKGPRMSPVS
ncbi:hypothetical protein CEXT_361151 [Caerostris extrusa]|uniref:Uncharacterized protein n=1 Tax=Caerostris extrusa TaxID=172846 RepID=A0AAV4X252_CAEEX|nr:hypothetical protein CEXT_361151 [Caerostris extrusa]